MHSVRHQVLRQETLEMATHLLVVSWTAPSKVTHFLLTALHRTATFGPDLARPFFDLGQTPLGTDPGGVPSEPKHIVQPQWRSKFY